MSIWLIWLPSCATWLWVGERGGGDLPERWTLATRGRPPGPRQTPVMPADHTYMPILLQRFGFVLFRTQQDADAAQGALQVGQWRGVPLPSWRPGAPPTRCTGRWFSDSSHHIASVPPPPPRHREGSCEGSVWRSSGPLPQSRAASHPVRCAPCGQDLGVGFTASPVPSHACPLSFCRWDSETRVSPWQRRSSRM